MATTATAESNRSTRVLVFAADDAHLCIDIDRVEAVHTRREARLHTLKAADATSRRFLIHRGEPALVLDLREAFGLSEILGLTDRSAFVLVRAGSFPLALAVDACVGVRDLDLQTKIPVPTALQRDGGFHVGHLVDLDGTIHTLLEPSRILPSALRERLDPFLQEARAFCHRENEIAVRAVKLRTDTTLSDLKTYARLTRRNGHTRRATAARAVLKAAQEVEQCAQDSTTIAAELGGNTLLRDLLTLSAAQQTGELQFTLPDGDTAVVFFAAGRIADARLAGVWGRAAVKQIVALHDGAYRFLASDVPVYPQRIDDAASWLLVEALEQPPDTRRGRHGR